MAKQIIDIGSAEQSGDGETLRSALNKVNLNFTELYNDDADFETQFNAHVNTATAGTDHILSWNGTDYVWRVDNDTIGIQYADLSVNFVEGAADGDGSLLYDQSNGVFQYSPPKLNGLIADGTTDFGTNKITYSNMYASLMDLPDATQYHGMFAHVHATGKGYFAHGGNWVELANQTDIIGTFGGLAGTPTTIAGYGITDALELGTTSTTALAGDTVLFDSTTSKVAIGQDAGKTNQGNLAVAIGYEAGEENQGANSVAIGVNSGETNQGTNAVAVGIDAGGTGQGNFAIAMGYYAGQTNQAANSIVLNATGATLDNTTADSFVVKPIRNASGTHSLEYNPTTGEVTYDTAGGGAADTDALPEGTTNLYYTDARVNTYLSSNDYDTATNIVASITDSAPGTLDTLNELAAALGDDPNFATTTATSIAEKLPLAGGTLAGDINVGGNSIVGGSSPINIAPGGTAKIVLSGETQLGGDVDGQSYNITTTGKILYANMYATEGDLPNATTYHGMFAHVHATGAGYFAHGGNWVKLANYSDLGSSGISNLVEDTTPQLGGTLDLNLQSITSQGNISIQTVVNPYPIDIGTSSVSGSAVNIGSQALNTPVNISGESHFGAHATFDRGVHERFYTITGATGTVTHNCWWGHLWYHTGVAADFTANITNLGLEQEDTTNVAVVINQGNTAYIPSAVEIAGVAQTLVWQGNSAPTGTANGVDTFSFTILNDGGTYMVLGQMTSFGGV